MKIRLLAGAVAAGLMTLASSAYAVPIAAGSTLSLQGQDTYTATSISFVNPANIGNGTGSFASLAPFPCNGCATMTNFTSTTAPGFQLYTAHNAANTVTTTLTVNSDTFTFDPGNANTMPSLTVNGLATLTLTGFDPTPGNFILTTQGPTGTTIVTFSVTSAATAVPEPASLAILGGALAGLGLFGRRRRKAA